MHKLNNTGYGILIGLVIPLITWFAAANRLRQLPYLGKPGVVYLLAVACNLFILRYCYKKEADRTGTGVMLSTFVFLVLAFLFKIKH